MQKTYQPVCRFFRDILHNQHRAATDVYAFMFLADVVDFVIIIFGFWAFGVSGGFSWGTDWSAPPVGCILSSPASPETLGSCRHHLLAVG